MYYFSGSSTTLHYTTLLRQAAPGSIPLHSHLIGQLANNKYTTQLGSTLQVLHRQAGTQPHTCISVSFFFLSSPSPSFPRKKKDKNQAMYYISLPYSPQTRPKPKEGKEIAMDAQRQAGRQAGTHPQRETDRQTHRQGRRNFRKYGTDGREKGGYLGWSGLYNTLGS